jgi:hemerythrin-like domain-containing protein
MIPSSMVMMMAYIAEWLVWAWSFGKHRPSMLKIERMEFLTLTRTYSIAKIRSRLGFQPWAKQPYKSVDEAVQGSLDWVRITVPSRRKLLTIHKFIQPENHGPIKLPSKTNSRPETPFRLISSTGATTIPGIPHDHYCVKNARIMAQTHNTFFRALNSIYQTSISIRAGTQEASDFLSYCRIVYEFIHSHQCHEESFFFPTIERETGISGLMDENIAQHKAMDSGLEAFRSYAEKTPSSSYSGVTLRSIIDSFAPAFESHNHAEISTILSLHSKISSSALQKIDEEFRSHAEKESDMFKAGPLVLGCQDNTFIIDDDIYPFPSVPFIVKVIVDLVLSRKHGGVWRFNPCSIYGRPRALPTFGVEDGKVSGKSDVVTKGMQFKSGVVVGSFRRLVPVFAALISVWSILSLVLL